MWPGALLILPCRLQEGKGSPRPPLPAQHLLKVKGTARAAETWAWPLTQLKAFLQRVQPSSLGYYSGLGERAHKGQKHATGLPWWRSG